MKPRYKLHLDGSFTPLWEDKKYARPSANLRAPESLEDLSASRKVDGASALMGKDLHPADVIAALRKRGTSLRQIAQANGYAHISRVLYGPWLAAEQLVAKALGVKPQEIWPSRYLDPADRARAFQLTRKIKVTMPRKTRKASSQEARV